MDDASVAGNDAHRTVLLIAYDGVDDLDFFGARSVLAKGAALAEGYGERLKADFAGLNGAFVTSSGVSVKAPELRPSNRADAVVVPGGAGATAAARSPKMREALICMRRTGARFYTICSGALLVGEAGLLTGMRVAMHAAKRHLLEPSGCSEIVSGFDRHDWLTSIGGEPSCDVKSVRIGFEVLADLAPSVAEPVRQRMEISQS